LIFEVSQYYLTITTSCQRALKDDHGQGGRESAASHAHGIQSWSFEPSYVFNGPPAMTTPITDQVLSSVIVQAVETGAYPEAEEVASSEIRPSVLPDILKELSQARQRVQVRL